MPTAGRHLTKLAAIGVLIAVAFVSSANTATAGCGDYVTVLNKDGTVAGQHHPAAPGAPCHGPNCSAERNPPPATPATTPLSHLGGTQEVAATPTAVEEPIPSFASRVPLSSSGRPVRRTAEPFVPPRSV